ncbi:glycosyltransferase family A protein [Clostridium sp. AN503]|uniref:glycosyltransferase family 2 protein n=1 Tax=Clostridium sp. AN503 TaxID=3160598 RepID=UPI003458368C
MDNSPLISVIMPAYNAEKTLIQAVQSVINQTYCNWELLIIDDCSIDNTYALMQKLQLSNTKIKILKNHQNAGVSESRNKGVQAALGSWIAFLDSDDMWAPNKLEKQVKLLARNNEAALIFTGSAFVNAIGEMSEYKLSVPETITYHQLLKQNVISCSSVMVKRDIICHFPMKYDDMHEDYAVWLQILKQGYQAYGINEPLLVYRLSTNSKSSNKKKAALMTYKVYRYLGLNHIQAMYYFVWYGCKNLKKYHAIQKK